MLVGVATTLIASNTHVYLSFRASEVVPKTYVVLAEINENQFILRHI
jgi:hypothetical protein